MGFAGTKVYYNLRSVLLSLPGVTSGSRFGGEAFFFGKRFFCHFHRGKDFLLLETFVWDHVDDVVKSVPGTIPHPQYGGYGWVRFRVSSLQGALKAKKLIEMTHEYMTRTRRISLPKSKNTEGLLAEATERFPAVDFCGRESQKRTQVMLEVKRGNPFARSQDLLNTATKFLRQS